MSDLKCSFCLWKSDTFSLLYSKDQILLVIQCPHMLELENSFALIFNNLKFKDKLCQVEIDQNEVFN